MANGLYDKGRESFLSQSPALDWDTDNIKLDLVDAANYTRDLATHQYRSSVGAPARVATSANFATKTVAAGVADAADVTLTAVTGASVEQIIIWKDTTVDATSPLIANIDTATGLPVTPNGGDITVQWDNAANRIFKL